MGRRTKESSDGKLTGRAVKMTAMVPFERDVGGSFRHEGTSR